MKFFSSRSTPSTPSSTSEEYIYQGRSAPRPPPENVIQLFHRMHHVEGDMIRVCASVDNHEPVFVQEGLLRLIFFNSVWYKQMVAKMELKSTNELILETQEDVFAIFVFWVFNTRVPGLHEVGQYPSIPSQDDEDDYQTLLLRTWTWADSVELGGFQNALMEKLFDTLHNPAKDLACETLQICLLISEPASKMRQALVDYYLWWENNSDQRPDESNTSPHPRLQPYIDIERLKSIEVDLNAGRTLRSFLEEEGIKSKMRPVAHRYLVHDPLAILRR